MNRRMLVHGLWLCLAVSACPTLADDPTPTAAKDKKATADAANQQAESKAAGSTAKKKQAKKKQAKKAMPLSHQMTGALRQLAPILKGKKIMAAAVPHYANSDQHWPAAPAVLDQLLNLLLEQGYEVPARVEHLILGDEASPPKELIDDLQGQFPFDLLVTADYRRSEKEIAVAVRVFDAKTRKLLKRLVMDLGNDVENLGYAENRKVWSYCHEMKGYMVGNGECWTLAASALVESQAQHPNLGYEYGQLIAMDDLLIPGDLFQLEGVSIQGPDGYPIGMWHHTAIVHKNLGGGLIELVHQNGPPLGRYVCLLQVNIYQQLSGTISPYRPIAIEAEN